VTEQDISFEPTCFIYFLPTDVYQEAVSYFDTHFVVRASFDDIVYGEERNKNRCIRMDYDETMQPYDIFTREPISQKDYVETRKNK
jgi:hypothetical protein